jgi:nucleotidyltransferase substrate binding protein (TIGR01987 family)
MSSDIRWKQRFSNFDRAVVLLREPFQDGLAGLSQLEKEGTIQRFEIAFELAWKAMKDYLEENGLVVNPATPRNIIKEAFAAKLLNDGQVWIDMMLHRNLLSHTYDIKVFEEVLQAVAQKYLPALDRLHEFFSTRLIDK